MSLSAWVYADIATPQVEAQSMEQVKLAYDSLIRQALDLMDNMQYTQALALLQEANSNPAKDENLPVYIAAAHIGLENILEARGILEKYLEDYPQSKEAMMLLAGIFRKQKNYDTAYMYMDDALRLDPRDSEIIVSMANLFLEQKKFARAIEIYRKALIFDATNAVAYYNLGNVYMAIADYEHAIRSFNNALRYRPNYPMAAFYLGLVYYKLEDFPNAQRSFEKARSLMDDDRFYEMLPYLDGLIQKSIDAQEKESAFQKFLKKS